MASVFKPKPKTKKVKAGKKRKTLSRDSGSENEDVPRSSDPKKQRLNSPVSQEDESLSEINEQIILDDGQNMSADVQKGFKKEDLKMYRHRDKRLQKARIGLTSQRISIRNVDVRIGTGRLAVRPLDLEHVARLETSMKKHIYDQLLSFRPYVKLNSGLDSTKKENVQKVLQQIESGEVRLYMISGLHRITALKRVAPDMKITIQIYDPDRMDAAAAQYITIRDNKALPLELQESHKPMSFKNEAVSVRSHLMTAYEICSSGNLNNFLPGEYFIEESPSTDDTDKTRAMLLAGYDNKAQKSLAGVTVRQFKTRFHGEIRGSLFEMAKDMPDHIRTMKAMSFLSEANFQKAMALHDGLENKTINSGKPNTTIRATFVMIFSKVATKANLDFGMQKVEEIFQMGKIMDYDQLRKECNDFRDKMAREAESDEETAPIPPKKQKTVQSAETTMAQPSTSGRTASRGVSYTKFLHPPLQANPKPAIKRPKKKTAAVSPEIPVPTPKELMPPPADPLVSSASRKETAQTAASFKPTPVMINTPSSNQAEEVNVPRVTRQSSVPSTPLLTVQSSVRTSNESSQQAGNPGSRLPEEVPAPTTVAPQEGTVMAGNPEKPEAPVNSTADSNNDTAATGNEVTEEQDELMDSSGEEDEEQDKTDAEIQPHEAHSPTPELPQEITAEFWKLLVHFMNSSVDYRTKLETRQSSNLAAYRNADEDTKATLCGRLTDKAFLRYFRKTKNEANAAQPPKK